MQTVIALLFCLLLGVMLKVQGMFALLWLPLGFVVGLFVTAQIALPMILGLPRATRLVSRGEMRSGVYARLLITPVLWVVVFFIVLFLIGFFWPAAAAWVAGNAALNVGTCLGIIAILLSPLSKKSRSDFREDFDRSYGQFYTGSSATTAALQGGAAEPTEEDASRAELKRLRGDLDLLEDPETTFSFGQMSLDGDGIEQDYVAAANWFRIAAEQGHAKAQHNLALMYENGEGVPQDYSEAAKWYHMAAEQGNPASQNNLGSLYETGEGVTRDYAVALEWYRRAAERGDTNAPANFKRLKPRVELERYQNIVSAFTDLIAANSRLIGDCSLLPHPKATILYAIKFVVDDYENKREVATDSALIDSYERMIPTLNYAFTCLARDWQDIAPEDKDAVARLAGYESFPEWALPLKRKYIDDERASKEAANAALQVLIDKVEREKADEN